MALPRFLSHNLGWKGISVLAAMLVWMSLKSGSPRRLASDSARTFRQLPVNVLTAAGDPRAFRIEPGFVDVRVSGPPARLDRLQATEIRVFVDLTAVNETHNPRLPVEVHTPEDFRLITVSPTEVTVPRPPPADPRPLPENRRT